MKIICGKIKGKNFYMPFGMRPTPNIIRKAIFDIIGHDLANLDFLDLFAGSGAVGWEAISCGAKSLTLVERDPRCVNVIHENLNLLNLTDKDDEGRGETSSILPSLGGMDERVKILALDAFMAVKELAKRSQKLHFVFADPPYGFDLAKKILKTLEAYDILHPDSMVIIQSEKLEILPSQEGRFILYKQRTYSNSQLSLYQIKT